MTRKLKDIRPVSLICSKGDTPSAIARRLVLLRMNGFDASILSHNQACNLLSSRKMKSLPFDCNGTERKKNMRERLRKKLSPI